MENPKKQLVEKLKHAQNVLVTVSRDPSVDQLSAAIGLTVALNNMGKHASAVFSGQVPSTLEFLQPEDTLDKNTDSLRDFIIALDKSKADKLRYKVEDSVVRIFITPYKASITQDDLDFSQGDFNVDVVVALGVERQQDLDEAIQAHGRILHDALVATITLDGQSDLGTLHISGEGATSLSEMAATIVDELDKKSLDSQAATALLTGIVAETERFSNDKTTPAVMTMSSVLMGAGANQQLIASELEADTEEPVYIEEPEATPATEEHEVEDVVIGEDGTLAISHGSDEEPEQVATEPVHSELENNVDPEVEAHEAEQLTNNNIEVPNAESAVDPYPNTRGRVIEPPSHGGTLTANSEQEQYDKPTEELTLPSQPDAPILSHSNSVAPLPQQPEESQVAQKAPVFEPTQSPPVETTQALPYTPPAMSATEPAIPQAELPAKTLADLERELGATHGATEQPVPETDVTEQQSPADLPADVADARKAIEAALAGAPPTNPEPITALNAQPLSDILHAPQADSTATQTEPEVNMPEAPAFMPDPTYQRPTSPSSFPGVVPESHQSDEEAAPPVPPPFVPPTT